MIVSSKEEHERFVKSLEKNGSGMNGGEWDRIADDMNWPVDDVKLYAYWYMQQLRNANSRDVAVSNEDRDVSRDTAMISSNPKSGETKPKEENNLHTDDNEWTYDESILFDTLSITYDSSEINRWEKVSSLIPNKNQRQCLERWQKLYGR